MRGVRVVVGNDQPFSLLLLHRGGCYCIVIAFCLHRNVDNSDFRSQKAKINNFAPHFDFAQVIAKIT